MTETKPAQASAPRLPFGRMKPAGHSWNTWEFDIPAGTPVERLDDPVFWAHYARQIQPRDILIATREDGAWEAEYRVFSTAPGEVRMKRRFFVSYEAADEPLAEKGEYQVKWIAPPKKFGVIRKADNQVLKDGMTRDQAVQYMNALTRAA